MCPCLRTAARELCCVGTAHLHLPSHPRTCLVPTNTVLARTFPCAHKIHPSRTRLPSTRTQIAYLSHATVPGAHANCVWRARTQSTAVVLQDVWKRAYPCSRTAARGLCCVGAAHVHIPSHPRTSPPARVYHAWCPRTPAPPALTPSPAPEIHLSRARRPRLVLMHTSRGTHTYTIARAHVHRHACTCTLFPRAHLHRVWSRPPPIARSHTILRAHENRLSLARKPITGAHPNRPSCVRTVFAMYTHSVSGA